jgi:hypothetical protein
MKSRQLLSILKLSEYIVKGYDSTGNVKVLSAVEWLDNNALCADVFGFTEDDIDEIMHNFLNIVSEA